MKNQITALSFDSIASPKIYVSNLHQEGDWSNITRGVGILWYPNDISGAAAVKDFMMVEEPMRSSTFLLFSGSNISAETPITDLQPFIKPFGGKDWIWCSYPHLNAKSMKVPPEIDKSFQPIGTTLSEMTFSLFLSLLHNEGSYSINKIPRERFLHIIQAVVQINPSSFIVSDGESLLAYCGGSDAETLYTQRVYTQFQGLQYTKERVVISVSDPLDNNKTVFAVSNSPLSDDSWTPMLPQQFLVIRKGQIVFSDSIKPDAPVESIDAAVEASTIAAEPLPPLQQSEFTQEKKFLHYQDHPLLAHQMKFSDKSRKLLVRHHTVYKYATDVEYSTHILRLAPVYDANQIVLDFKFALTPETDYLNFEDVFGNQAMNFAMHQPYREMTITTESLVEIPPSRIDFSHPLRQVLIPLFWTPWQRQMMSPYLLPVELPETELKVLSDYAMSFVERNYYNLLDTVLNINDTIYRDYRYNPGSTSLNTTPFQVFTMRQGVCQDFASLFICLARLLNIPARYRVGYIYTGGDYENKLQSDASHAWVELYLPNIGWLGFDPTNNIIVNQDHVRVACGRNYLDATPTSGTIYKGGYGETLYVDVKVTEV